MLYYSQSYPYTASNFISRSHIICFCSSHLYSCNLRNNVCACNRFQAFAPWRRSPRSARKLSSAGWQLLFDVSVQPIGPIFMYSVHRTWNSVLCSSDVLGLSVLCTPIRYREACKGSCTHHVFGAWSKIPKAKPLSFFTIWCDIFVNCNWVATRWQWYSTHLYTNNT
jgi:hypothetical protein